MPISTAPCLFAVEGIVGSGKTNLLATIRQSFLAVRYAIYVVESPVVSWQDVKGVNLLQQFHTDPHRHAFAFLSYCLTTRATALRNHIHRNANLADPRPILTFMEGSLLSDTECWAASLVKQGQLTALEFNILQAHRQAVTSGLPALTGIIMMNTPVSVSMRTVQARGREGEVVGITQRLQHDVQTKYREWLQQLHTPRIHIDFMAAVNQQQPASYEAVVQLLHLVDNFITRCHMQHASCCPLVRAAVGYGVMSDDEDDEEEGD